MAVVTLTDETFEKEVLHSDKPVLVDFWAEWCIPCQMVGPVVDELSDEFNDLKVAKLNIDENTQTPGTYGVMSIPTIMLFKNGKAVKTFVGVQGKDTFKQGIHEALSS